MKSAGYNKFLVPPPVGNRAMLELNMSIDVVNILLINEVKGYFRTRFILLREWYDPQLNYKDLKKDSRLNLLSPAEEETVWFPEVVFENVTFNNPVSLDIYNRDMAIVPTFKLISCKFKGDVDIVKEGLNHGSINKIRVENDHVINNCLQNSSGVTIIQENMMGFLSAGDIEVKGGKTLSFVKNMMEFVQEKSIEILDIKSIDISENYFGFPISGEPVSISYSDMTPRCLSGPIPYSSIDEIQVRGVYYSLSQFKLT